MKPKTQDDLQRLVAYVPRRKARMLKAKLALEGNTYADWLRNLIDKFIAE